MQDCPAGPHIEVRTSVLPANSRALPPRAMTLFGFCGAILITASNSAATPLYRLYQETMHLTPFWITIVFATYVACLLIALLTVGGLSDYVGRRPVILAALLLNGVAMLLFAEARDLGQLILARAVQGFAVGIGTTALGAAILDTNRTHGPVLNSVGPFVGLMAGSLGSATLLTFAPDPIHLIYEILLGLTVLMIALLWVMPESMPRKAGALASLWPQVSVPRQSRATLVRLTPANIASWALGGLYLSLMPTVVATAMHALWPWVGGVVVSTLMLTAAIAIAALRSWSARRLILAGTSSLSLGMVISMCGIEQQQIIALLLGSAIAGAGFGITFSGALRALMPTAEPHQRAGLLSAFYIQAYLAFSLPAIAAGLSVPLIGLSTVAYIYGAMIIVLAIISMIALLSTDR